MTYGVRKERHQEQTSSSTHRAELLAGITSLNARCGSSRKAASTGTAYDGVLTDWSAPPDHCVPMCPKGNSASNEVLFQFFDNRHAAMLAGNQNPPSSLPGMAAGNRPAWEKFRAEKVPLTKIAHTSTSRRLLPSPVMDKGMAKPHAGVQQPVVKLGFPPATPQCNSCIQFHRKPNSFNQNCYMAATSPSPDTDACTKQTRPF